MRGNNATRRRLSDAPRPCKSAIELFELDKLGTLRYLLRGGEQRLDLVLSEAVVKSVSAIGFVICRTLAARPSNPARRSIGWQARKTFVAVHVAAGLFGREHEGLGKPPAVADRSGDAAVSHRGAQRPVRRLCRPFAPAGGGSDLQNTSSSTCTPKPSKAWRPRMQSSGPMESW